MAGRKTRLFPWHQSHGATIAEFGGFDMPLWYQSAKQEHLSVLTAAGLFDTGHMSAMRVAGDGALALLQKCFTNDLAACTGPSRGPLTPGRCVYGAFLTEAGHVVDDAICFMVSEGDYLVVVNAGMGRAVAAHMAAHGDLRAASIDVLDGRFGKVDLQGPASARILAPLLEAPDSVFDRMPYFSFKGAFPGVDADAAPVRLRDGTPILLSRTGYTGEFGFEIFTAADAAEPVWEALLEAGAEAGITACGLAARDSLRAGAVLPLSHQDIGDWPFVCHPWPFAVAWNEDGSGFTKPFVGDRALLAASGDPCTYPFVGDDLRKVSLPAEVLDASRKPVGKVLTCATDMGIGRVDGRIYSIASPDRPDGFAPRGLCCGFVRVGGPPLLPGARLTLADDRRSIPVTITQDIRPDRTARRPIKDML